MPFAIIETWDHWSSGCRLIKSRSDNGMAKFWIIQRQLHHYYWRFSFHWITRLLTWNTLENKIMEFLCFKFSHPVFFSHNTPGSMAIIVGSTRTHVFVTRIVGNDPDKGSLTFSGFPTKPNHQSPQQSKLWPRRLHECWRSLCKSAACRRTSKSATAAGSLELIDSVKSATGRWSTAIHHLRAQ